MNRAQLWLPVLYVLLAVFAVIMVAPFAWMICASLKNKADFFDALFLPGGNGFLGVAWDRLTLEHYQRLFAEHGVHRTLVNSIFLSSVISVLATLFTAMAGYALSKFEFRAREILTWFVLAMLVIPAPLLLAPGYQLLHQLDLLDSYWGLVLPAAAPAFGVFLFRQSILNSVHGELLEAARIDGAGEIRIFFRLVLPLVRPMAGAFLMITFLGVWNNFVTPQVVLQTPELFPLAVMINNLRGLYGTDYGLLMSGTFVSIAPVMCLFLLLQKEFIQGLTSGAVKG
jgi:ABC-type sugar transport system, permease component